MCFQSILSGVQCYLWFYQRYSCDPQHGDRGLWVAGDGGRARDDRDIAVYRLSQGGRTRGHGALGLALCAYNHTNYSYHLHDVTSSVLIAILICFAVLLVYIISFDPQTFIHLWRDSNPRRIASLIQNGLLFVTKKIMARRNRCYSSLPMILICDILLQLMSVHVYEYQPLYCLLTVSVLFDRSSQNKSW